MKKKKQSISLEELLNPKHTLWDKITLPFYVIRNKWKVFKYKCERFKKGYADNDVFNLFAWFIDTVKPMLVQYKTEHWCRPCNMELSEWDSILSEMIGCLDLMDEHNAKAVTGVERYYDKLDIELVEKTMEENKQRFFELFSKYFYDLWD